MALEIVERARNNLEPLAEVEIPGRVEDLQSFLGRTSEYDPYRDALLVDPGVEDDEIEAIENSLIEKYVADEVAGDEGLDTLEELEEELDIYHEIVNWNLFGDENSTETPSKEELDKEFEEVFGEEPLELDEETPSRDEMKRVSEKIDRMDFLRKKREIGEDDRLTRRLAALRLGESIDEILREHRKRHESLEKRAERELEGFVRWTEHVFDEKMKDLIDEETFIDVIDLKTRALDFDIESGMMDLNIDRSMRGEETEPLGTGYETSDVVRIVNRHGYDESTGEEVFELMKERDRLEQERDSKMEEIRDSQYQVYEDLKKELDRVADEKEDDVELYLEPLRQRFWKIDRSDIEDVSNALKILHAGYRQNLLDEDTGSYRQDLKEMVPDDEDYSRTLSYLEELLDVYESEEGNVEERVETVFDKAPELAM